MGARLMCMYAQHGHLLGGDSPVEEKVVQLLAGGKSLHRGKRIADEAFQPG